MVVVSNVSIMRVSVLSFDLFLNLPGVISSRCFPWVFTYRYLKRAFGHSFNYIVIFIYIYILLQFNGKKLRDGHNNDKKDHKGDL